MSYPVRVRVYGLILNQSLSQ